MTLKTNKLRDAITFALVAGATAVAGTGVAVAQQTEEATTLDRIQVTGSRIKRADIEGAQPLTVLNRETIEASGDVSVADFIRNIGANSFGSFRPRSGSSAQSFAGISLRGLGEGRTLVLIDGRRLPMAPTVGGAQDLNAIPLAAVERIEILKDGASAVYGSDAIGGVVNIITRKDFEGVEVSAGISRPSQVGGDTEEASVLFGTAGDRGNLMGGISYNSREIIFQRDRPWSRGGASTFSNNFREAIERPDGSFAVGGFLQDPVNGSVVPGGCDGPGFTVNGTGADQRCAFDFTSVAADEAAIKNQSLFLRGEYHINDDWSTFLNASVSRVKSFGRYAPVAGRAFVSADAPTNPYGRPLWLDHRFGSVGNRDQYIDSNVYDFDLGAQGRVGEVELDFGIRQSEYQTYDYGRNYVLLPVAAQLIADGSYNILDPFSSRPEDLAAVDQMRATIFRDASFKLREAYATANFDLFEMGGGSVAAAVGAQYQEQFYADIYDAASEAGSIGGSAGNSAAGDRDLYSAFFEVLFPFTSNFEATLAGRYDRYSDYGSDFSPKLGLRYQPLSNLTLRASYSEGFSAPSLDILTQQPSFSADFTTDRRHCESLGLGVAPDGSCFNAATGAPVTPQLEAWVIANPNLESEKSRQGSFGVVWDATEWLSISMDYYNIRITDSITAITSAQITQCLEPGSTVTCPPGVSELDPLASVPNSALGLGVARFPNGAIAYVQRGFSNLDEINTDGIDWSARTRFDMGDWGRLSNDLELSWVHKYTIDSIEDGRNLVNKTIPGGASRPRYRGNLRNTWAIADWTFNWNINYIHSFYGASRADLNAGNKLASWTTHDLQVTWAAPWNARIAVGVRNVGDKAPVLDPFHTSGRGYAFDLYDAYGRVPYVRYTQSF